MSVRLFLKQIPMVKSPSFVSCDPSVEVLKEVYVCLDVLAKRSRRYGFFILEVIVVVPKFQGKVLQDCPNAVLALTESKGQYDDFLL